MIYYTALVHCKKLFLVVCLKKIVSCDEIEEHTAEREHVTLSVVAVASQDLGRSVPWSPALFK
jgi:hypothetical protein